MHLNMDTRDGIKSKEFQKYSVYIPIVKLISRSRLMNTCPIFMLAYVYLSCTSLSKCKYAVWDENKHWVQFYSIYHHVILNTKQIDSIIRINDLLSEGSQSSSCVYVLMLLRCRVYLTDVATGISKLHHGTL